MELELCNKFYNYNYPKDNNSLSYEVYRNCFINNYENLDKINSAFKNCNFTCEACEPEDTLDNHNNIKCSNNFSEIRINGYSYCYINCSFHYYLKLLF